MEVKHLGPKTFFLKSGVWYDSEYDEGLPGEIIEVKFLSDEYFTLVKKHPAMVKFLSIGDNLVICWEGKVYKITLEGSDPS